jgi:hypothetical protein
VQIGSSKCVVSACGTREAPHVLQGKNVLPGIQPFFLTELCIIVRRFEECAVREAMVANTSITMTKMNTE